MTKAQIYLYRAEWSKARKAGGLKEHDRHEIHIQVLGADKSSLDLTNAEFDKVLAAFRAVSAPYNLKPQLRAQEQPNTRRLHKIANLLKCLGLFVAEPVPYATAILSDKYGRGAFHPRPTYAAILEDLARVDLNAELIGDKYSPRPLGGEGQGEGVHSELEKLIFTLSRCVSVLRRKGVLHAGGARSTVPQITEHEMCRLAKVPCFRPNCAACRDERKNTVGARSTRVPNYFRGERESASSVEPALHSTTEEEPF
jgi:hypothetical protein